MLTSAGAPVLPLLRLLARWPDACYAALACGGTAWKVLLMLADQ